MDLEMLKRALADIEANPGGEENEMDEGEHPGGMVLDIGIRPVSEREEDLLSAFGDENPDDDSMAMFRRSKKKAPQE